MTIINNRKIHQYFLFYEYIMRKSQSFLRTNWHYQNANLIFRDFYRIELHCETVRLWELSFILYSWWKFNLNSCADSWHERAERVLKGDNGGNERDSSEIAQETPPEISRRNFWCNKNFSKFFLVDVSPEVDRKWKQIGMLIIIFWLCLPVGHISLT